MNKELFLIGIIFFTTSSSAYAYLDPGSGSMLLSIIVGVIVSIWFYSKSIFYKIRGLLRKKTSENCINNNEENENIKDE